jgi:hypothetical protein
VYGIPGFEVDGQESREHVALTDDEAIAIAADHFDIMAQQASRLDTERDDTFRLDAAGGTYVLKIAHPVDSRAAIDFEIEAVDYARRGDAALPLPRIHESTSGDLAPALAEHDGRLARLFHWLPGIPLADTEPNDEQVGELGRTLGRLTNALAGFGHPAAHRPFAWDAMQFPRLATVQDAVGTNLTGRVFEAFEANVAPREADLPRQVIHNDFNPGNVLVDPDGARFVTGIIDFGDAIDTARVCDLAVALSYELFPMGRNWHTARPFIEAYELVVPLEEVEREVLPTLVAVRLAQRFLMYQWMQRGTAEALDFASEGNLAALAAVLREI